MKNEAHLDLIAAKRTNSEHLGLTLVHKSKNLTLAWFDSKGCEFEPDKMHVVFPCHPLFV